jgi:hypothetical protein
VFEAEFMLPWSWAEFTELLVQKPMTSLYY